MAGTKIGGLKAAATNRKKYGKKFYANIGAMGGLNGRTGGFAANPTLARLAGAKGGRTSTRGSQKDSDKRTIQIVKLYRKGKTRKEIADKLGINHATVGYHLRKAQYES